MGGAGSDNYKNFFLCHLSTVEDHSELDTLDESWWWNAWCFFLDDFSCHLIYHSSFRKPLEITDTFGCSPLEGLKAFSRKSADSRHCVFAESLSKALDAQGLSWSRTFLPPMGILRANHLILGYSPSNSDRKKLQQCLEKGRVCGVLEDQSWFAFSLQSKWFSSSTILK